MTKMFNITTNASNKDIPYGLSREEARDYYLDMYRGNGVKFKSLLPEIPVEDHFNRKVVRCDLSGLGFKAIAAEKLIANTKSDVLVYCAPRAGHAPLAIAELARLYGKKAVFFAPASGKASTHQLCTIALGAELRFVKIAAMPVLNLYAKKWAEQNNATFLPFGLANIPFVTAGIVDFTQQLSERYETPKEIWCATSTGTMIRGLQIGWPDVVARSIAVSRNIHDGEIGEASVDSAELPFLRASKVQPPFPTTAAYDAKAWEPCLANGSDGAWFMNVGCDQKIEELVSRHDFSYVNSVRQWGDHSDLERGL